MAYREDEDLAFLGKVFSSDLDVVFKLLTEDKDGDKRFTEALTVNDLVKHHHPDHKHYWHLIAEEIQCFGGNSFANVLRGGKGVLYKEVLTDVCDKMKVNYNKNSSTETIEMNLLMKVLTDSMKDMTPEQLKTIAEELDLHTTNFTSEAVTAALQVAIKMGGFASYKIALIVANAIARAILGKGLMFATNATITRTIGIFAGPIGWAVTGAWTLIDIAGPAHRVTIPVVIQIAFLRAKLKYGQ